MTNKQALTVEAISQAFAGTNFGRDDLKNILAETVIDAAAGWRCGYTATTICTQLGLLTPKGRASALGLRFISEHVQREIKRLKDELEAKDKRIAELEQRQQIKPCPKCNDTGMVDSGGTQPWGEPIEIECDCRQQDANTAELVAAGIITRIEG